MKRYKVTIKERGSDKPVVSEYYGNLDERGLIAFYGLEDEDVEWYKIELI